MKEIKFRAWDGETMVEVAELHINTKELLVDDEAWLSMRHSPLMQYTGLHDNNGREIYEGDIVHAYDQEPDRYEPDYRGSEATGIVEFHGSMFMLDADIVLDYPPILEVIGNIYDNPELMEVSEHE